MCHIRDKGAGTLLKSFLQAFIYRLAPTIVIPDLFIVIPDLIRNLIVALQGYRL